MKPSHASPFGTALRTFGWILLAASLCLSPAAAAESAPKERSPAEAEDGKARLKMKVTSKEKDRGVTDLKDPNRPEKPPRAIKLPAVGEYAAEEILTLVGRLTGRTVRIENELVRKTKVKITKGLAEAEVNLDELTILLAAHRLYLCDVEDPKEGKILVASKSPQWREEAPRFTAVIEVDPSENFRKVAENVEKAVKERNARLPKEKEPIVAVTSERTGKIFVRAPTREDLDAVARLAEKKEKDPDRPHLYTYTGEHQRVSALKERLLEKLSEPELDRLVVTEASRGNRLYFRCPASVWEKVTKILKDLDKPEKKAKGEKP